MADPSDAAGPFGRLRVEHASTVDRVAEELRRALFDGELAPGTGLREAALTEALGVSRSTVREALAALVAEGLATREPNRGVHVTALDPEAVRDVCRARTVLETAGVRRWHQASSAEREAVEVAMARFAATVDDGAEPAQVTAAHLAVHRALAGLAGSARLLTTADQLASEVRLALATVDRVRRNAPAQVADHQALVRLLQTGDVAAVERTLTQHLEHAESSMLAALELPGPDDVGHHGKIGT